MTRIKWVFGLTKPPRRVAKTPEHKKGIQLATYKELADFLAEVERRAFKQAVFSIRDEHLALDIVQEAMLKLSEKYAARPVTEFPMLFQRILQNAIRDFFRRQKVRSAWVTPLSSLFGVEGDEDFDPLESMEVEKDSKVATRPAEQLEQKQVLDIIEKAIATLPLRQRQAFMLRYWEELDVAEAAKVMGCSEGSVKTHCSRATHALAKLLKKQGIEL
jgi:RNA polymerase sigma-70 factor, ECF subfamily